MLKKSIFAVALFFLPPVAHAEITSEIFCFSSRNGKPINFEMRTYYDASSKFSSVMSMMRSQGGFFGICTSLAVLNNLESIREPTADLSNGCFVYVFDELITFDSHPEANGIVLGAQGAATILVVETKAG